MTEKEWYSLPKEIRKAIARKEEIASDRIHKRYEAKIKKLNRFFGTCIVVLSIALVFALTK